MSEEVNWQELTEEGIRALVFPLGSLCSDPKEPGRRTISWGRPTNYLKPVPGSYSTELLLDIEASFKEGRFTPKYRAFCLTPEGKCLVRIATQSPVKRTLASASEEHKGAVCRHFDSTFELTGSMRKVPVSVDYHCIFALRKTRPVEPTHLLTRLFGEEN